MGRCVLSVDMAREAELARIYDAHAVAMHAFGLSLTRSESDTRDLLQDAFVKLARDPGVLLGARDERGFLLRLMRNGAIDLFRRRGVREAFAAGVELDPVAGWASGPDPDEAEFRRALWEGMGELPAEQREVVHLKLWEDRTFDAIAGLLGLPLNTVASRYRYGLEKLRRRLRPLYEELQ